jgi:hypothetical protein
MTTLMPKRCCAAEFAAENAPFDPAAQYPAVRLLTRVAEQMASSQPAITSALAELESMFGGPLFDRSVRGMAPTRWASWCWPVPRR